MHDSPTHFPTYRVRLFALSIILHESILTPQLLEHFLCICFSGIADVGVGKGSLGKEEKC